MGSITENSFKEKKKIILHINKRMASYEKEDEQSKYYLERIRSAT